MPDDALTIATAIDPTRQGWCWRREHSSGPPHYDADIGPHNMLKVIEWAAGKDWFRKHLDSDEYGETRPGGLIECYFYDWLDGQMDPNDKQFGEPLLPGFVDYTTRILAAAIRAEKGAIT